MEYSAYLFVHFTGESEKGEQIYFSVSKDGLHWNDLNNGEPVITSTICEKGVRDPFIVRSKIDGKFYIISTDLRIANGKGWGVAQEAGSRNLMITSSDNLLEWNEMYPVEMDVEGAGCVWAPETIYDVKNDNYLVFWASKVKMEGDEWAKQRIYSSRTRDFKTFSKPELYIERENHVIDTTIIEENGIYYRFSKDETTKNITSDKGTDVGSQDFTVLDAPKVNEIMGVEGPAAFKFNDKAGWCLLVDRFATDKGYLPIVTEDISTGEFRVLDDSEYDMGLTKKRHGSVLNITEDEYSALIAKWNK